MNRVVYENPDVPVRVIRTGPDRLEILLRNRVVRTDAIGAERLLGSEYAACVAIGSKRVRRR